MQSLACDGRIIEGLAPQRKVLALVDNDTEGRSLYANGRLKNRATGYNTTPTKCIGADFRSHKNFRI